MFKLRRTVSSPSVTPLSAAIVKVTLAVPFNPPSVLDTVNEPVNVAGLKSPAVTPAPVDIVYGNTDPFVIFFV